MHEISWGCDLNGNAIATLTSENCAIACFQPERVRDGFAKTLWRFYLYRSVRRCACGARQPPFWQVTIFFTTSRNRRLASPKEGCRALRFDGRGFAPTSRHGRWDGLKLRSLCFSIFPLVAPPGLFARSLRDFFALLKIPSGQSTAWGGRARQKNIFI